MGRKLDDWIRYYGEYTAESDSPQAFHTWCCLGTIAGAAQRKIFMQSQHFPVFPNLFIVLVSPPGRGKKGAALRASKNILKEVKPEINFAAESGSMEGIFDLFLEIGKINEVHQSLSLYSMELGTLMATNPAIMVDFLTDIYDGNENFTRITKGHGKKVIPRPFLNLQTGTTPRWLGEHIGLIALEGGLLARSILTYSDELILKNPWPEVTHTSSLLKDELVHDLSIVAKLTGEFKFEGGKTGEALQWYSAWYEDHSRYPLISDPRTASYFDRKHIHLLKVAMSLSLSYKDELVLTLEDIHRAKALLDASEPGMRLALNAVGKNDSAVETFHIMQQIRSKGRMSYGELLIENYHNLKFGKKSLDQALEELARMGRIKLVDSHFIYTGVA